MASTRSITFAHHRRNAATTKKNKKECSNSRQFTYCKLIAKKINQLGINIESYLTLVSIIRCFEWFAPCYIEFLRTNVRTKIKTVNTFLKNHIFCCTSKN